MKKRILLNLFRGFLYLLFTLSSVHAQVQWSQLGFDIDGEAAGDESGFRTSISADGLTIAVGASGNNANDGHVRVFRWNGSTWVQLGSDLDGNMGTSDAFGASVSLSSDGNILAVGAPNSNTNTGHVSVYSWNGSDWVQIGNDII